jgi:hypothetical protein
VNPTVGRVETFAGPIGPPPPIRSSGVFSTVRIGDPETAAGPGKAFTDSVEQGCEQVAPEPAEEVPWVHASGSGLRSRC